MRPSPAEHDAAERSAFMVATLWAGVNRALLDELTPGR
ncbi:hypothetical protein ACNUDN_05440 [Mycobacterium sp. smrl_JER01]